MRRAGRARLAARLRKRAPRMGERPANEIIDALGQQSVVVSGTKATAIVLPGLAEQLARLRTQRDEVAEQVEAMVSAHPLHPVLTSMPGVGIRTAAKILTETSGKQFPSAAHFAAYAGLAPVTWRSGESINSRRRRITGNRKLKPAMFLSAFAVLRGPVSRAYYDRKIANGKSHTQAVVALARRRSDVLYAMLRDGRLYNPDHALAA